jgi:hypothetical protein
MRNRPARIVAAVGAAVLLAAPGATTALAVAVAKTWTIQPGGAIRAVSGRVAVTDTTTGATITCLSSKAAGTLEGGSGLPGTDAGSLSALSFATCSYPASPTLSVIFLLQPGSLPWQLNLSSYKPSTGVVRGAVGHLVITLTDSTPGAGCSAMIDGSSATAGNGREKFSYTDGIGQLTVLADGGNLHLYDVTSGCFGIFKDGDPATLTATYTVHPEQDITSP